MTTLKEKYDQVYTKAWYDDQWSQRMDRDRYIPMCINEDTGEWGIFDGKRNRYLNHDEIGDTPLDELLNEPMKPS